MISDPWAVVSTEHAPEVELIQVAHGRVMELEKPIFIAAAHGHQVRDFIQEEALTRSEVRRITRISDLKGAKPEKILLLMPSWHLHRPTREAVEWWVNQEGYTVTLENYPVPYPSRSMPSPVSILLWSLAAMGLVAAIAINL